MKQFNSIVIICTCILSLSQAADWMAWETSKGVPLGTTPSGHEDIGWTYKIDNVDYTAIRSIPVWPIRAKYGNYFVPGKLVGDPVRAYLPWGGGEVKVTQFEVFVNKNVKWVAASNGVNPPKAVAAGGNGDDLLYIGRAIHQESMITGKVQPKHHGMYISFAGREIFFNNYEVLVYN